MKLITKAQHEQLRSNNTRQVEDENFDPKPVVKLFFPASAATWLLTDLDEDGDRAFGLCDLGFGFPELGYVSLAEMAGIRHGGFSVERDRFFKATKPLSEYAAEARSEQRIVA